MIKVVEVVNNGDNNHHRNNINDNKKGNFRIFLSVILLLLPIHPEVFGVYKEKG